MKEYIVTYSNAQGNISTTVVTAANMLEAATMVEALRLHNDDWHQVIEIKERVTNG